MATAETRSNFHGSWRFVSSENYEAFIEAMYKDTEPDQPRRLTTPSETLDIAVQGDKFTIRGETTSHTMTVGQPQVDHNHWAEETRVARWQGRSLVVSSPGGGGRWTTISEVADGDQLVIKYVTTGGLETKCFYKRVADDPTLD